MRNEEVKLSQNYPDILGLQRMSPNDFPDPLTFPPAPSSGQKLPKSLQLCCVLCEAELRHNIVNMLIRTMLTCLCLAGIMFILNVLTC